MESERDGKRGNDSKRGKRERTNDQERERGG